MAITIQFLLPALALSANLMDVRSIEYVRHQSDIVQMQSVAEFTTAVNQYVELRRLLEDPMSRLTLWADREQTARARRGHRAAILEARGALQRGMVFTPRVAAYFRRQIEFASVKGRDPFTLLPELPKELEYRAVGRDLVVFDAEIDVVVDILDAALPVESLDEAGPTINDSGECAPEDVPIIKGNPCDVHDDLPMCWS